MHINCLSFVTLQINEDLYNFTHTVRMDRWPGRLLKDRLRRRRLPTRAACGLAAALAGVCGLTLYLAVSHPRGLLIPCECGTEVATGEREARYLSGLMAEFDPVLNKSAVQAVEDEHPSLAASFLLAQEARGHRCSNTPGLFSLHHANTLWQQASLGSTTFHLYSAYFDTRHPEYGGVVRVVAAADRAWPATPTCHLWFPGDVAPTATRALSVDFIHWQERLEGHWLPFLVTCRAGPHPLGAPEVVAVVPYACAPASNALRVQYHTLQPKKDLALCHKFLFNPARDDSVRLVEWVEAARAWGVDRVVMYQTATHPNVSRVLHHYQAEGFMQVVPWTNPGHLPSLPHLSRALYDTQRYDLFTMENVPYTDCLLRHVHTHRYVAVWDLDEFVLPASHSSLPAMLDAARSRAASQGLAPASYVARCAYYFDDQEEKASPQLPEYLFMLRHVTRTLKLAPPAVYSKAVHDTDRALALHAHFALHTVDGAVNRERDLYHLYPASEAHLAHYRHQCQGEDQQECRDHYRPYLERDTTMWRHKYTIVQASTRVLRLLGLQPQLS